MTAATPGPRNWDCKFCPLTFDRLSAAEEHAREKHPQPPVTAATPGQAKRRGAPESRRRPIGSLTHADMGRVVQVPGYGEGILWGIEHVAAIGDIAEPWTRLFLRRTWHGADEVTRGFPPEARVSVLTASAVAGARDDERKVLGITAGAAG